MADDPEDPYGPPATFAATVTGRPAPVDALHAGVVTEAMVEVFLGTHLPDDVDRGVVADNMRAVVDAADLQIGGFSECAAAAAAEVTDRLTDDDGGTETKVWDGPEAAGTDTRVWDGDEATGDEPADDEATGDEPIDPATALDEATRDADDDDDDDSPPHDPEPPVTADELIAVVFDVTIEDVSEMLSESGELVEEQRERLDERGVAGGLDRDRDRDGIGR